MTMKYRAALLVYLALLWPAHLAHAQQSAAPAPLAAEAHLDAQLLRALLEEVRQLRLAVQKGSLSQHRSQLLLERIARQQDRVEGLNAEIEQVREQLQVLSQPGRYDEELKGMEEAISRARNPQERARLEEAYDALKRSLEEQRQADQKELERQRERERALAARLQTEQARLAELQEQLEAIEREMDKQVAETRRGQ
jgi:chromosome segregation ATPase